MADIFYIFNEVAGNTENITSITLPTQELSLLTEAADSNVAFVFLSTGYAPVAGVTPRGTWT